MAETVCEIPSDVPPALSDSPDAVAEKALRNVVTTALSSGRSLDDPGVRGLLRRQLAQWRQCFSRHGAGPSDGQKTAELLSGLVESVDSSDPGKPHPRALANALSSGLPSLRTLPSGLFQGRVGRALLEGIGRAHPRALAYAPAEVRTDPNLAEVFRARMSAPPTVSEQALNKLGLSQEQTTAIAIGATDTSHGSQQMAEKLAETLKEAVGASGGKDEKAAKTVQAAVALVSAEIGQKKQEAVAEIVQASKEGTDSALDVLRKSGYATAEGKPRFDRIHADVMKIALARAVREAEARGDAADPAKKPAVTDEIFDASVDEFLDASGLGGGGWVRDPLRAAILLHAREKTVAAVMGSRAVTSYVAGKTSAEQMRKAVENAETAKLQDGVKLPAEFPFSRGPMEWSPGARMMSAVREGKPYTYVTRDRSSYDIAPSGSGACVVSDRTGMRVSDVAPGPDVWRTMGSLRFARQSGLGFLGENFVPFLELAKKHVPSLHGVELRASNGFAPGEKRIVLRTVLVAFGLLPPDQNPTLPQLRERFDEFSRSDRADAGQSGLQLAAARTAKERGKEWFRTDGTLDFTAFSRDFASIPLTSR